MYSNYLKVIGRKISHIFPSLNKYVYSNVSYAQEGEDLILLRFFNHKKEGFFIDVGAHHPTRFSNTYLFYRMGWRGINIDAMPGSMKAFKKVRPRDINIECPISDKQEELTYFIFNEPALNTFSEEEANRKNGAEGYYIIDKKELITQTLSSILENQMQGISDIDFLSIDVEGLDFQVLKSYDWTKTKPKMILIEALNSDLEFTHNNSEIKEYLAPKGYQLFAKTGNTVFFKLEI